MPLELRGLQAWITCDDVELPQYQVEQDSDKSISCYIPSEAGKAFVIRYKGNGFDQSDICLDVFIDGRYVNGELNSPDQLDECGGIKGKAEGSALYPFVFAAVHVHEEETSSSDDLSQLGLVEITVFRVKINESYESNVPTISRSFSSEIGVPERSKLAGYNCTILGEPVESTMSDMFDYTYIDSADDPFCVFRFRHLPREMLQARGIIPQDAPPEPAHAESPDVHKKRKRKQEEKSSKRFRPLEPSSSGAAATTVQVKEEMASGVHVKAEVSAEDGAGQSSASDDVRIRALENTLQTSHTALLASQQALQASQDALRTIQTELEELKGRRAAGPSQCKVERRPSPIHVGSFDGQIIDLTSD